MDEIQPLSNNESFSNGWLMNMKNPIKFLDSPNDSFRFSLDLEADHSKASMQCTNRPSQEFNFGLPCSGSVDMSHADQMMRNGSLIPLHLMNQQNNEKENNGGSKDAVLLQLHSTDTSKMHSTRYHHVEPDHSVSPKASVPVYCPMHISLGSNDSKVLRGTKLELSSFEGSAKSSKRIIVKYLGCLVHFYKKIKGFRLEFRRLSNGASDDASLRTKLGCSCAKYDVGRENAIAEAILHCKSSTSTW